MSLELVTAVLHLDVKPHDKIFLVTLANCANPETGDIFPSQRYVMAISKLSERKIQYLFREYVGAGLLVQWRKHDWARHRPAVYRFVIERLRAWPRVTLTRSAVDPRPARRGAGPIELEAMVVGLFDDLGARDAPGGVPAPGAPDAPSVRAPRAPGQVHQSMHPARCTDPCTLTPTEKNLTPTTGQPANGAGGTFDRARAIGMAKGFKLSTDNATALVDRGIAVLGVDGLHAVMVSVAGSDRDALKRAVDQTCKRQEGARREEAGNGTAITKLQAMRGTEREALLVRVNQARAADGLKPKPKVTASSYGFALRELATEAEARGLL